MCLAIPGKVLAIYQEHGVVMGCVDFEGVVKRICLEHVPDVKIDEYVIVHVGYALTRLDEVEAGRIFERLKSPAFLDGLEA